MQWWTAVQWYGLVDRHDFISKIILCCIVNCDNFNTLRPSQNGCHFADDIFKCILLNENVWITIKYSLKFVRMGQINNIPALVHIMGWRRPGDKPLSEPMTVSLQMHICVTQPQWVKAMNLLTHCGLVTPHGAIDLDQCLLRWWPSPEWMLTCHQSYSVAFTWQRLHKSSHQLNPSHMFEDNIFKRTNNSLWANELNVYWLELVWWLFHYTPRNEV